MRLLLLGISFCSFYISVAQYSFNSLTTPYNTVRTHLENLQPESYNDSIAAQAFNPKKRGLAKSKKWATQLKRILDGKGIYIYMDEVPKSANYLDSISHQQKFVLTKKFPTISLLKNEDGNWYYSDSSIATIDTLYGETFPFGSGKLLDLLPLMGRKKILGLYLFQYITILILAFLIAVIYRFFSFATERIIRSLLRKAGYGNVTSEKYLLTIARPISVFFIILLLKLFIPILQLPPSYGKYIFVILKISLPFLGTIVLFRMVNILSDYLAKLAETTEGTLDDQLVPLLRKTLKIFVVITGTLFILDNLDVDILPLLTGLSIGGLAFALAAQDTIKNFFGSIMIFIDKPFQVGDWVTTGDLDGTVEEVGFRSSRVRTFRNSLIYVPNGKLADSTIDNHGRRNYRRFYTQIAVTYDTPPGLLDTFIEGLRKIVQEHPDTLKDNYHVYLNDMAASSLNIMFYIFFVVPDWGQELRSRHEVLLKIIELAEELGVNFAFPTQTLHVENLPGQPSLSPSHLSDAEAKERLSGFFGKSEN